MAEKPASSEPSIIYDLRVTIAESDPPIWRLFAVSSDTTLAALHDVLQPVIGWDDCHLHLFETDAGVCYESKGSGFDSDPDASDERKAKLSEVMAAPGDHLRYDYDFGDGWEHDIELVAIHPPAEAVEYPIVLAGELNCPMEDSGGIDGHYEKLAILKKPRSRDYRDIKEWMGDYDPSHFDLDETNASLEPLRRKERNVRLVK